MTFGREEWGAVMRRVAEWGEYSTLPCFGSGDGVNPVLWPVEIGKPDLAQSEIVVTAEWLSRQWSAGRLFSSVGLPHNLEEGDILHLGDAVYRVENYCACLHLYRLKWPD